MSKHVHSRTLDTTSPERPQSIAQKQRLQKQLKIEMLGDTTQLFATTHRHQRESPEAWFQRIMKTKQLSPLDLCDLFSYGDVRRHPVVPLSHVCEVLYDLDPEVAASGHDPVTPSMEDFLYQFSFEGDQVDGEGDEIVVSVKDALRSLDIWQSGVTSPPKSSKTTVKSSGDGAFAQQKNGLVQSASPPRTKSAMLAAKNKQLQGVISSLQDANLRLSQQLGDAMQHRQSGSSTASSQQRQAKAKPERSASPSLSSTFLGSSTSASPTTEAKPHPVSAIVNQHEDALVKIATRLQ